MGEYSEAFVAFDVSKTKHAVAIADGGRGGEVRFLGDILYRLRFLGHRIEAYAATAAV